MTKNNETNSSEELRPELEKLEREWSQAIVSNDAAAIGHFMADDWLIVGQSGITDKKSFLYLVESGDLTHEMMEAIRRSLIMSQGRKILRVMSLVITSFVLGAVVLAGLKTKGQDSSVTTRVAPEQWEYLALAGPVTGLTPVDNPRLRKEPNAAFNREAFALEQQLDKLGANGWELVAVAGPPTDPAYYFKRRKLPN